MLKKISKIFLILGLLLSNVSVSIFAQNEELQKNGVKSYTEEFVFDGSRLIIERDGNYKLTSNSEVKKGGSVKIAEGVNATITLSNFKMEHGYDDGLFEILDEANVTLILEGDNSVRNTNTLLEVNGGWAAIRVVPTATLTIEGSGSLVVESTHGAAIGGNGPYKKNEDSGRNEYPSEINGDITINSGTITAISEEGAGIGGGFKSGAGNITINGGTIVATSNFNGTGIGGGSNAGTGVFLDNDGIITINGGTITATGNNGSTGIGGGKDSTSGTILINGGNITANGDTSIGAAGNAYSEMITIAGNAQVTANGTIGGTANWGNIVIRDTAHVVATGERAAIGANETNTETGTILIEGNPYVKAVGNWGGAGIGGYQGPGGIITITGGTVEATGGFIGAAGIGGGADLNASSSADTSGGIITISGGNVTAIGGGGDSNGGPGIGKGKSVSHVNNSVITISGGSVYAQGAIFAAGIGASTYAKSGDITISGGFVQAYGTPGIGGGHQNSARDSIFSTTPTGNAFIVSNDIEDSSYDDWSGVFIVDEFNGFEQIGSMVLGDITMTTNAVIPEGKTLQVSESNPLNIAAGVTLTNEGTILLDGPNALTGEGSLAGGGEFIVRYYSITEDMITVPEGRSYDHHIHDADDLIQVNAGASSTIDVLGKQFVSETQINLEDWERTISLDGTSDNTIYNAGTYTVTYTKGDEVVSKQFSIAKATPTIEFKEIVSTNTTYPNAVEFYILVNGATANMPEGSIMSTNGGTITLYDNGKVLDTIETDGGWELYRYVPTADGAHNFTATFESSDTNFNDIVEPEGTFNVQVNPGSIRDYTDSTQRTTYNGLFNQIEFDIVLDGGDSYVVSYKKEDGSYTTVHPALYDVGVYEIEYKVSTNNHVTSYGSLTYTVEKALVNYIGDFSMDSWVYGDVPSTPSASVPYGQIHFSYRPTSSSIYTSTIPSQAGEYRVKAEVYETDNYRGNVDWRDFTIAKKDINVTLHVEDKVYDGTNLAPQITATIDGGLVGSDEIVIEGLVGTYADANVGDNKAITVDYSNMVVSGSGSENYELHFSEVEGDVIKAQAVIVQDVVGNVVVDEGTFTYIIDPIEGAEYSKDGITFQESNVFEGFVVGDIATFSARMKEDENHVAGVLKVGETYHFERVQNPTQAALFEMSYAVDYDSETFTITIPEVEGAEYSFDGIVWSDVNTLTGIDISSEVTGYVRMKETPVYVSGEVVSSTIETPMYKYPLVSFDANGGELDEETMVEVDRDGHLTTLPLASKLGYLFNGWYTADGILVSLEDTYTEDTTLYANWIGKPTTIIEGMNQVITQGDTLRVVSDGEFSLFKQVLVDGKVIDTKYYTVVEGSVIVTLSGEYTKMLAVGTHELTIVSETGTTMTTFSVKAPVSVTPPTGDTTSTGVWMSLLVLSLGMFVLMKKRIVFNK